jgi:hypothetical protein
MFFFFALILGLGIWFVFGGPGPRFLVDFAKLFDHSKITAGFANRLARRSYLTGEFRGRKVLVTLQRKRGRYGRAYLVVSMETSAMKTVDAHEFSRFGQTRDAELALFALEGQHALRLRHEPGCLKASWEPIIGIFFPGRFEQPKWQSVLEAMHTLAGTLDQRAARG